MVPLTFDPGVGMDTVSVKGSVSNSYFASYTQAGSLSFAYGIGNYADSLFDEMAKCITTDRWSNIYVAGEFTGSLAFPTNHDTISLTGMGYEDILVTKYDPLGQVMTTITIAGPAAEYASALAVDSVGNLYVCGTFYGPTDFDPGPGAAILTNNVSYSDIFLAKYDSSGKFLFVKAISGTNLLEANAMVMSPNGDILLTGYFSGDADFDPGPGLKILATNSDFTMNAFVARFDSNGNNIFAQQISGRLSEGDGIAVDKSGNIVVTGTYSGTGDFDPGPGTFNLTTGSNAEIFVARYDASGNFINAFGFGGAGMVQVTGIALDASGNTYLTGYFSQTIDFDPGPGTSAYSSKGFDDIYIAAYDPAGHLIYAHAFGNTGEDVSYGIASTAEGQTSITGFFSGQVGFDPANVTQVYTSPGFGDKEIFLACYDARGKFVSAKAMGHPYDDMGMAVALDPQGNLVLTGNFSRQVNFGTENADGVVSSLNGRDVFVAKYFAISSLPIKLINFSAKPTHDDREVMVTWSTGVEVNNDYFELERSDDLLTFIVIGRINGCLHCNTVKTYSFVDRNPLAGVSYYRLKQVDIDHHSSDSDRAQVVIKPENKFSFNIISNNSIGSYQLIIDSKSNNNPAIIDWFNTMGVKIKRESVVLHKGKNTFAYTAGKLMSGIYMITVAEVATKTQITKRLSISY